MRNGCWGPWFWVHLVYSYSLILAGDYFIIRRALSMSTKFRWQAGHDPGGQHFSRFLLISALPLRLIPFLEVNYDPLGFVLSGIFFSIGLFEFQLFELKPIARQLLIDNMRDGMLVLDREKRIIDINKAALNIFRINADEYIGRSFERLLISEIDRALILQTIEAARFPVGLGMARSGYMTLVFSTIRRRGRK